MKQILLSVLLIALSISGICLAQTGQVLINSNVVGTVHPNPYNLYGAEYPRIEADSRVTFRFNAPDAKSVQVAIANVPFDMVKGDNGVWTYTSEPQDKGYHNYWMIVDSAIVWIRLQTHSSVIAICAMDLKYPIRMAAFMI